MKVFDKYLVIATREDGNSRIAASFKTKKEATERLTKAFGECAGGVWNDTQGNTFSIEKNTKEYK